MAVNLQIAYPDPIIQKIVINRGVAGKDGEDADVSTLVAKADYTPAFSILVQQSGTGSPEALQVGTGTLIGRISGGGSEIDDLSPSTTRTLLNVEDGADKTNTYIGDVDLTSATSIAWDVSTGRSADLIDLAHDSTVTISGIVDKETAEVIIQQDSTGSRTFTFAHATLTVVGITTAIAGLGADEWGVATARQSGTNLIVEAYVLPV